MNPRKAFEQVLKEQRLREASNVYKTWKEARTEALKQAHKYNLPIAIRKVKEYGKVMFAVGVVSKNDADYHKAEIVKPTDKMAKSTRLTPDQMDKIDEGKLSIFEVIRMLERVYSDIRVDRITDLLMNGSSITQAIAGTGHYE